MHEYSETPLGDFTYDANGNLTDLVDIEETFYFDAQNRLVEHWIVGASIDEDMEGTIPEDYTQLAGTWSATGGYLHETGGSWGRILRTNVPADLEAFQFSYSSTHDPADPDEDEDPDNDYDPEYYALALLRVDENSGTDEWTYLALVIEPNRISLREWVDDAVTELDSAAITSDEDTWYDVVVTLDDDDIAVSHGEQGGTLTEILSGTTAVTAAGDIGFGVGEASDYWFDEVRVTAPSQMESAIALKYTYDALGRRVAETVYATDGTPTTTYFVYDGDRVIEEVDGTGAVIASYAYGQYVDEVLHMRRGSEDYYYLHDDQYNVLGVTDDTGALVERYAYGDFGDPTIYDASSQEIDESAIDNRYLFNGREWDAGLGLYHYRTRFMDPKLGRFVSRDTIGLWGDETNLGNPYAYLNNNPWSGVDPYGEGPWGDFWNWIGLQGGGDAMNNRPAMAQPSQGTGARGSLGGPSANVYLTGDPIAISNQQRFGAATSETRETTIDMGQQIAEQQVVSVEAAIIAGSAGPVIKAAEKTGVFGWIGRGFSRVTSVFRSSGDDVASGVANTAKVVDDVQFTSKLVPNPGGRLGNAVTQGKTREVINDLRSRGFIDIRTEVPFKSGPLGSGMSRYADVVGRNPATGEAEIIQIGETLRGNPAVPLVRERRALDDIIVSPELKDYPDSTIRFVDKNRPGVIQP